MTLPPFQKLLDSHRADVYRFLVATVGPTDADDCFQETWIAALRAYPRLSSTSNLRGWLLRIAQRKAVDSHRVRARSAVPVETVPDQGVVPVETVPDQGVGATFDGDDAGLWKAVGALPPKQRTAVYCRSVLGMPYRELAGLLGCSEDAARRNVHEGLKRLREEWSG